MRYRIRFKRDDDDTLLVTCPDLPEVTTFGVDEADGHLRARDAILTALQGRIATRQDIPEPSAGRGRAIDLDPLVEAKIALDWHGPSVDRLLDLDHDSRFGSMAAAFRVLGREMHIAVDEPA